MYTRQSLLKPVAPNARTSSYVRTNKNKDKFAGQDKKLLSQSLPSCTANDMTFTLMSSN